MRLRRRAKLIIGVVLSLALLICGVTYLLLIEWSSTRESMAPQRVETELLRSGQPTRMDDPWSGGYSYDVRFYNASNSEAAGVDASIQREPGAATQYRLTVSLSHPIETWYLRLDGDSSTTHLESLSLTFNFSRRIEGELPFSLLTPREWYGPSNASSSFSLESTMLDVKGHVFLLNFTKLRNLEEPPSSPVRWSRVSFQFLMAPETGTHFDAFTLEISFTVHLPSGGKVMYQKGTTALDFQPPPGAASLGSSIVSNGPGMVLVLSAHQGTQPLNGVNFTALLACSETIFEMQPRQDRNAKVLLALERKLRS